MFRTLQKFEQISSRSKEERRLSWTLRSPQRQQSLAGGGAVYTQEQGTHVAGRRGERETVISQVR
jgi:hypothetical protein